MSLAAGNAAAREDELLRLRQENSELKKANLEKGDTVKKLGVQLTRIQADWKSAAAPKDLAPVAKAHAKADASKAERISELEVELSQRAAREQKLQQQLALLKAGGAGPTSKGSAGVTRQGPFSASRCMRPEHPGPPESHTSSGPTPSPSPSPCAMPSAARWGANQ